MKEIVKRAKEIKELVVSDANHDKFAVMSIGDAKTGELISCTVGDTSKVYFALAMAIYELSSQLEKKPLEDTLLRVSQFAYEIEREEAKEDGSGDDEDDD